jgi:branched-chain amino acid transport system substrate-binding protein
MIMNILHLFVLIPQIPMKKLVTTFLLISSLLVSSLIAVADDSSTYDVHAAYALTGFASTFGAAELNGTTLAIDDFNRTSDIDGKKVKLIVDDTQSANVHTLSAVRKLMSVNKAKIILGPTWLDSFQSALPIADREKILLFTPSAAVAVIKKSDSQYPLIFSTWFNLELEIELLLKHVKTEQKKRIILAFDQDPFFQTVRAIIQKRASSLDVEIVSDESFDLNAADFRSLLVKTKKLNIDGAILGFGDEKNLLTFLKQRKEINPSLPLFGTEYLDGYVSQDQWIHLFDNVDFISAQVHDKDFAVEYEKRFKTPPVLSASTAYDATTIVLQALKANKRTPADVRDYLLSNEFNTTTFGKVRFNSFGGVQSSDFEIKKVRNREIIQQPIS